MEFLEKLIGPAIVILLLGMVSKVLFRRIDDVKTEVKEVKKDLHYKIDEDSKRIMQTVRNSKIEWQKEKNNLWDQINKIAPRPSIIKNPEEKS